MTRRSSGTRAVVCVNSSWFRGLKRYFRNFVAKPPRCRPTIAGLLSIWLLSTVLTGKQSNRDRHFEFVGGGQANVVATLQIKSALLFAAQAQGQKAAGIGKPDRAYDSASLHTLLVTIFQNDHNMVGVAHGASEQVFHFCSFDHGVIGLFVFEGSKGSDPIFGLS